MDLDAKQAYQFGLLPLAIWREAQNQRLDAMIAVGHVIRNRVASPKWWGSDYPSVILKHYQFSSFNWDDPNGSKFPNGTEPSWENALVAASDVFTGQNPDPSQGATYYFDKSLDDKPPKWSTDGSTVHTVDVGAFHFYREL